MGTLKKTFFYSTFIYRVLCDMVEHIFAGITDTVALYLDMTVYIMYLTKMPTKASHTAAITLEKTLLCGEFTVGSFLTPE